MNIGLLIRIFLFIRLLLLLLSGYGIGLFYVTPGGQIMLEMVDYYGGTVLILALAAVEVMAIGWIYGTNTLTRDFNFMLKMQLNVYWR